MDENSKKKVDESWKETAQKGKDLKPQEQDEGLLPEEPSFTFFVTTLGMQASIALGDIPNPITNKQETNLKQAKFFIDTLAMIKEKTINNLSLEEDNFLESLLYELKMRFVAKSRGTKDDAINSK